MRAVFLPLMLAAAVASPVAQRARPAARASSGPTKLVTTVACVASLGEGVKSHRAFCDVLIGAKPAESVEMTIPAHVGTATLRFDLHNRFTLPLLAAPALSYSRHEAVVAVVRPTGDVIARAAVVRQFRSVQDLFDQIAGGARAGGVKAVAPGQAEPVTVTIPPGVSTIGIVGSRLQVVSAAGEEKFDSPGRPIAVVSNLRIEYKPGR